jgi:hypothetical protein
MDVPCGDVTKLILNDADVANLPREALHKFCILMPID